MRAPEQTTEEFLREISSGKVFPDDERRRLQDFLESSDLVKFAAYRPDLGDVSDAYQRARVFVGSEGEPTAGLPAAEEAQVADDFDVGGGSGGRADRNDRSCHVTPLVPPRQERANPSRRGHQPH